jgi:hypothetical protein
MRNETKYLIVESPVHNQEVLLALTATSDNKGINNTPPQV